MAKLDLSVRGRTGLKYWAGHIDEELHRRLRNQETRIATYSEMRDNDPTIGAINHAIDMLIRNVDWTVEPDSPSMEDELNAEFLRECQEDMSQSWSDFISEALSMLPFGWAYFEQIYKVRQGDSRDPSRRSKYTDGKIGWRKFAIRSQDSLEEWAFDEDGSLLGMWQSAPPTYIKTFIPIEKALLFRTKMTKGSPEAVSIYRNAVRPWYFLKRLQEIEAIGIERDLAGLPDMQVPPEILSPGASDEEKSLRTALEKMLGEIKRDERAFVLRPAELDADGKPTGFKFGLINSGGQRQVNTNEIINRYEQRIAMTVLAEFIFLGMDKVGSFALSSSKTHLFAVALGAWLQSIADVLNTHAVPRLFKLNGMRGGLPKFVPGDVEDRPLDEIADYISKLTGSGLILPDEKLEREVRRIGRLPEPDEHEGYMTPNEVEPEEEDDDEREEEVESDS